MGRYRPRLEGKVLGRSKQGGSWVSLSPHPALGSWTKQGITSAPWYQVSLPALCCFGAGVCSSELHYWLCAVITLSLLSWFSGQVQIQKGSRKWYLWDSSRDRFRFPLLLCGVSCEEGRTQAAQRFNPLMSVEVPLSFHIGFTVCAELRAALGSSSFLSLPEGSGRNHSP